MTRTTSDHRSVITAGRIRSLLEDLPATTPVLVGIRDRHHVNTLHGELAVIDVAVMPNATGHALVLFVETVS